jgi:hypothetical protein
LNATHSPAAVRGELQLGDDEKDDGFVEMPSRQDRQGKQQDGRDESIKRHHECAAHGAY